MSYIIAVAAPVGGGKTSLVRSIATLLQNAETISFDHYENISHESVDVLIRWMEKGGEFNEFIIPALVEDLKKLKSGHSVIDPLTKREITAEKYIIFEMPLGKEHADTAVYIDLLIWVDLPLDIALARKIREYTDVILAQYEREKYRECIQWMNTYLTNYLLMIGDMMRLQKTRVRRNADIIVDGRSDVRNMAEYVVQEIVRRSARSVNDDSQNR